MFRILDRYIGKTIFNTIILTLFMLVSLSGVIKFVDQLRKTGQGTYTALAAGYYTLLSIPKDIEIFFPMAVLLGTLLGLGTLAQRSELVVMQAVGFLRIQLAVSVMKTAIPLVLLTMAIGEFVAPGGEQLARNYRAHQLYGGELISTQHGIWEKDGNNFIYIERVHSNYHLDGLIIYNVGDDHRLKSIRYAAHATWNQNNKRWNLVQVNASNLNDPEQITSSVILRDEWITNLTPDKLSVVMLNPAALSILGLYNYIKYLMQSGQESNIYWLNMWNKIFQPLSVTVMMLMAISFVFGPLRGVSMGLRVVIGISFGFLFYVLDQIFGPLSLVYGMPAILGAIMPSALFFIISVFVLIKRC
ncbi:LPS export ABC transporter permease LptG [Pantoea sp. Nvir]|uniref:LPS export ABC transporter permease LptG n=1 Tax=Pantoea sp. Nvir TaxID=2576760 RepID=UPI00280B1E2B|nr:LPS export ABC transporter permease LptG [Pantoea sp. Nvir]